MFGAVLGDIVGSPYERPSENILSKNFPLFSERLKFTDDTVMALAVTDVDILGERVGLHTVMTLAGIDAFLDIGYSTDELSIRETLIYSMQGSDKDTPIRGMVSVFRNSS